MDYQQRRGTPQREVLPLTVRRALWEQLWDRLLAPLPEEHRAEETTRRDNSPVSDSTKEGR